MRTSSRVLLFAIMISAFACKKADLLTTVKKTAFTPNTTLPGKWKVAGNWMSSGGPMYFVPADGKDFAVFNAGGTLDGSAFPNFKLYTVKDSVTLHMTSADNATYEDYYYKIKGDTLTLGLAGPIICIEGCAIKLVKE